LFEGVRSDQTSLKPEIRPCARLRSIHPCISPTRPRIFLPFSCRFLMLIGRRRSALESGPKDSPGTGGNAVEYLNDISVRNEEAKDRCDRRF
jgi:hypothetical protein